MISATVKRRYLSIAPRKVRFVVDAIRSKNALTTLDQLQFINKRGAKEIATLLKSAIAAAKQKNAVEEDLFITNIQVDEGPAQKRRFLLARGQSTVFKKSASHIVMTVSDEIKPSKKTKNAKKTPVKKAKEL